MRRLLADTRGAFQVEYTIVLVLVALVAVVALAGLAIPLVQYYRSQQTAITSPIP
jgi:Flp pilus assembly pilin Flp